MSRSVASANLLSQETSPYLLQHKDNPVHWMPWGEPAFALARAEDKPVLLSVGYAACHWCHVMAHESFEDPETAALINRLFVPVKVDREERPDLDHVYQMALALMGQHGGWPLTLFLTTEGEPFGGGTYFPPFARYGRPSFRDVLGQAAEVWRRHRTAVSRMARTLTDGLAGLSKSQPAGPLPPDILDAAAARIVELVDPVYGGIGDAPKFPHAPAFELVWRAWLRGGRAPYRRAVINTLTQMCQGGLYDHVAGGFARYSTDDAWLVPHFEKMLYDQAALIDLATLVWRGSGEPLLAERVAETVGWLLRDMVTEGGGFASSIDADSDHEEGRYTVWTEAEIDAVLGPDAPLFKAAYGVTACGNWEGRTILNRSHDPAARDPETEALLAGCRARLLEVRSRRVPPGLDDKVLADWNGLAIAAVARAGLAFGRADWVAAGARAFRFVVSALGEGERLHHAWRAGTARHAGLLEDYAGMAAAALALAEATGDDGYVARARMWSEVVEARFRDGETGGFFMAADDGDPLLVRPRSALESAVPGGAGLMAAVAARLHHMTGDEIWRTRAEATLAAYSTDLRRNVLGFGTLLNAAETLDRAVVVVVAGTPGAADAEALRRAAAAAPFADVVVLSAPPGHEFAAGHPAHGKGLVDGRAAAYVCADRTCGAPIGDPAALAQALAARVAVATPD